MSEEIEKLLLKENEELKKRLNKLEGKNEDGIPSYSFSKIKTEELKSVVDIKENLIDDTIFDNWFNNKITISSKKKIFLKKLIKKNIKLINIYDEEDLKVNFIVPLILDIDFLILKDNIRSFYHEPLKYETDKFIFNGKADFMISKGLKIAEKPYFFIQEFKKGFVSTNPEPQLLAELISAIELNNEITIKGAYIIGATWNFVILEKLGKNRYQYFVSRGFNCCNINDLKEIYKNLVFIKNEIVDKKV